MSRYSGEPKKEDMFTVIGVLLLCFGALVFLIWLAGSVKIVNYWTPKLFVVSRMWGWIPGGIGAVSAQDVHATAMQFLARPKDVGFFEWIGFVNLAVWPLSAALTAAVGTWFVSTLLKARARVQRKFAPQALAENLAGVFTGTAPVLHLRKAIAQDKEPMWRRQTFPHEVLLNERVNGRPLVMDARMVEERAAEYFRGIETERGSNGPMPRRIEGRLVSRMLGRQVVDLLTDRGKRITFPDRFSPTGKVIFALLCAHAFGGEEGKKDYAKARDQLNNSARGAVHGFANLTVAQWVYDKYRDHPTARNLFAVHHWEYTYLFELLVQAKRQGKCGHWEFIWLKPMNRILFYVMNTVGRLTPHTEAAGAFGQFAYERKVARRKRLPLMRTPSGGYVHVIYTDKAVKGLGIEWERWLDGDEDDERWWASEDVWKRLNGIRFDMPKPPPKELAVGTPFDQAMSGDNQRAATAHDDQQRAAVGAQASALQ
jgi:hypothetical protein